MKEIITIKYNASTKSFWAEVTFPGELPFMLNESHENPNYALSILLEEVESVFRANGWCCRCATFHHDTDRGESWNNAGLCPSCYEALGF